MAGNLGSLLSTYRVPQWGPDIKYVYMSTSRFLIRGSDKFLIISRSCEKEKSTMVPSRHAKINPWKY